MDSYYDLDSNRIFVRGFRDLNAIHAAENEIIFKPLNFLDVNKCIYLITQYGIVVNNISKTILNIDIDKDGYTTVVLSSNSIRSGKECFFRDRYRIVDLVAYNFIRNSDCYLERGCIAFNKNRILTDNYYSNVVYLQKDTM